MSWIYSIFIFRKNIHTFCITNVISFFFFLLSYFLFHIVKLSTSKLWTTLKLWTNLKLSTTHWVDSIDESFMFCMNWIQMTKENDWRFKVKIFSIGKFSLLFILYLHGAAVFTKAKFKGNENSFENCSRNHIQQELSSNIVAHDTPIMGDVMTHQVKKMSKSECISIIE